MLNRKFVLLSLLIFLSLFTANLFAQPRKAASIVHRIHEINSKAVNEKRTILVNLPVSYERSDKKFPVIYMLDGHTPQPGMMGGILAQQAWAQQIPEIILVSIQNTNRSYDMTPTVDARGGKVGGANKFLEFIETEVIPLVEKNYRTQPYRIFAGHSLGGLAVVYSFVSRPNLFNAYIAASPVLHYDNNYVIREAAKLFKQKRVWNKTMFLGLGDEPRYKKGWNKFQKLLKTAKPKGFEYEFKQFPEENHASVVLRAYYWGLRKIYKGWMPKQNTTVAALEKHYKNLTKKYGYTILVPEETFNRIGYQFLRSGRTLNAINVLKKNIKNYPNSPNAYDSLGEAYEKSGSMKLAKENYEKAYKMATAKGNTRLAKIFEANLNRVSK